MLIDNGATVNQMSYSIFKKLCREDDELVKANLMLNGMGGNPMEFIIGSMSLATAFFIIEVQGNYSVILDRDWIPSTLHQFLI
jgi:hypothetical protein